MKTKHFILTTAGHVDHGKSALVKALSGTDPDRLPEEKARKITIELGFAHISVPSPQESDLTFSIGIIDVPGHEDFVRNMIAGAGAIDIALLVVAADDGWMAQTEEHLEILSYLGARCVIVVLHKIDLAQSEDEAEADVRGRLQGSLFASATIVRTSTATGRGLARLKKEIANECSRLQPAADICKPRLFVDRAFSLRGIGTVVTGTVSGGVFNRGERVSVQPTAHHSRIRSAQTHNCEVDQVGPGMRAAFNLTDVTVAERRGKDGICRGHTLTRVNLGAPDTDVDVSLLPSLRAVKQRSLPKNGTQVRVHHGTSNSAARLFIPPSSEERGTRLARLRFAAPVFFFARDRLIIRDSSQRKTIAGAIVLDPNARTFDFRAPKQWRFLQARAEAPGDAAVFVHSQVRRDCACKRSSLLLQSRFSKSEVDHAINRLICDRTVLDNGGLLLHAEWWNSLLVQAGQLIDAEHRLHPEKSGLPVSRLTSQVTGRQEILELLVTELCRDGGFARTGDLIYRSDRRPALSAEMETVAARIRTLLAQKGSDPPRRTELAPDARSRQALHFLRDTGEIVELDQEIVLWNEHFGHMRDAVLDLLQTNGSATTSELRKALATSRRIVIPLLERLDRDGLTRRVGDKRVLARSI